MIRVLCRLAFLLCLSVPAVATPCFETPQTVAQLLEQTDVVVVGKLSKVETWTVDEIKLQFGERFDSLNEIERTALAITLSEGRLTHGRLSELTDVHPTDISKSLRGLVAGDFLVSEGNGRGTVYRFPGVDVVTPEDVFDASSPDLEGGSSVTLGGSSVTLEQSSVTLGGTPVTFGGLVEDSVHSPEKGENGPISRDTQGRLISSRHHLAFVDDLSAISSSLLQQLQKLAAEPRAKGKVERTVLEGAILEICTGQFVTLSSLATLLDRSKVTLRTQYLTQMCRDQKLRMAFPDKPNDSRQAYTKA